MFKKVALYGLAFGSMSAAMLLVQYFNGLYRERNLISAIPVLANIIIPALGVFLFVRSLSQMKSDKPINMGKALFGALLVCVIVAFCNVGAYQHIMTNRKDIVKDYRGLNYQKIEEHYNQDSTISADERKTSIQTAKDNFEQNIEVGSFGRMQFMMCLSTGMVVALITFLRNYKRQ